MTTVERLEVPQKTRVEYSVSNPCYWRDVYDALAMCRSELGIAAAAYDDAVKVRADEESIVFWFEK